MLPTWTAAPEVYSTAYRVLDRMAARGHVTMRKVRGKTQCDPSEEIRDLIDALNKGDEERIKGLLLDLLEYR
jgi:hypothetical protein